MEIDVEKCVSCQQCIPYCPVQAIIVQEGKVSIDLNVCFECGACIRSEVCPTEALYIQELHWPRTIRAAFSGTNYIGYNEVLQKQSMPRREFDIAKFWGGGRGTTEMKTNDVTNKYKQGEVGIGCELGRPGVGFYFRDLEKLTTKLVANGIEFERINPVAQLLDPEGKIKKEFQDIKNERALSAIVEFKVAIGKAIEILQLIKDVSKEFETVFSVNIINRCDGGRIPFQSMCEEAGIEVAINGKTCIGLGGIPT